MLEERLEEINQELSCLYRQKDEVLSFGLKQAILNLERKKENFKESISFWRNLKKIHPNYGK